ncbi:MAG: STAS domain-containing protein [Planctomycetes bacterium]|nr:STAS domain-containing protein [Planctomycetota bacterium]
MATKPAPKVNTQSVGDVTVIYFSQKRMLLDESNIQAIYDELINISQKEYKPKLVLDLANVQYLSSAVIGKLVAFNKTLAQDKGQIKLCAVQAGVMKVFKITKLDKIFKFFADQDSAVKSYK